MSLLSLDRIDAFYGDLQALHGVTLHVDEGETVAIVGANGAGKSTLLGAIAGLVPARNGEIAYDSNAIGREPAHRRARMGIALVPEGRRIFPSLSVSENLLTGGNTGRRPAWSVDGIFELFPHLKPLAARSAALLSGGEQQAVAIGRALMSSPRLLLLDEVSLGLAPVVVGQLYQVLPKIISAGTTVVLVEQNVELALSVSTRVYCLLKGRIALEGRPAEMSRATITSVYFGL